jgi:hypothetical protein
MIWRIRLLDRNRIFPLQHHISLNYAGSTQKNKLLFLPGRYYSRFLTLTLAPTRPNHSPQNDNRRISSNTCGALEQRPGSWAIFKTHALRQMASLTARLSSYFDWAFRFPFLSNRRCAVTFLRYQFKVMLDHDPDKLLKSRLG